MYEAIKMAFNDHPVRTAILLAGLLVLTREIFLYYTGIYEVKSELKKIRKILEKK